MSTAADSAPAHRYKAIRLEIAVPWYAYVIPLKQLPLQVEDRPILLEPMQQLVRTLRSSLALEHTVFLQLDELHQDNTIRMVSRYAQQWAPQMGLGLYPEAPPPRYWTSDDLLERDHGSPVPALMHQVMHLDTDSAGNQHAGEMMTGTAGLIQVFHNGNAASLLSAWHAAFQPTILEEGLAAYPFYLPLLTATAVSAASHGDLARWMGEASIYVRESKEDGGILVVSNSALEANLRASGLEILDQHRPTISGTSALAQK